MATISQREARRLRKQVTRLRLIIEEQRHSWSANYLGGREIARASFEPLSVVPVAVRTARKLDHAAVVIAEDDGTVRFIALPHPAAPVEGRS